VLLLCPGALQELVTGGDYLINAIYVAVSVHLLLIARADWPRVCRYLSYVFFALCLSSRAIYVVEIPIVAAFIHQRRSAGGLWEFLICTSVALVAINLPIFLIDPHRYPLFFSITKLNFYPAGLHAKLLIPATSLGIAGCAWLVKLSRQRVFLLSALSFIPMFTPGLLFTLFKFGAIPEVLASANYSLPLTIFGGIWLCNLMANAQPARESTKAVAA
jgi:hypothetical protein